MASQPAAYLQHSSGTAANILCCTCGTSIEPNPSNMCVNCLRTQVDITENIPKQQTIFFCRGCNRYLRPPWVFCELESKELLMLCLKKLKQPLSKVNLVDAKFVWTEPHSRRLKVKLTIQKEVFNGTILQQEFIVEYVVSGQQCDDCQASYTAHDWKSCVQVRQKVSHKRTMLYLEQLILKHNAQAQCLKIKEMPDGIDFFFGHRSRALKFVDFLQSVIPCKHKQSRELVSQDDKSNTYNYKYSYMAEIAALCKDDVCFLPQRVASQNGNISPFVLCTRVSSMLHFIDPYTCKGFNLTAPVFWRNPFKAMIPAKQMIEFTVLDIEPLGPTHGRFVLAEAEVVRSSDFGRNDTKFTVNTHLGNLLNVGDTVMGYDFSTSNFNDGDVLNRKVELPEIMLVKKCYERRRKNRYWKLQKLDKVEKEGFSRKKEGEIDRQEAAEYEAFLQDLEEDKEMRANVNLYKDQSYFEHKQRGGAPSEVDDDDAPQVGLEELLDELTLNDAIQADDDPEPEDLPEDDEMQD
eukprot:GFYU01002234.1.p1 GENE.GFYU01002234.1~~GFYU01002234.1.p1  ORF type:complete len:520 (-),score=194.37 GFYU01002234.1:43-1602(-)